jgi:hypothetical protein
MAQQQPLGALDLVELYVVGEGAELLEHLARDRFRPDVLLADPRVLRGEFVERAVDEVAVGFGILELLEFLHALVVFDSLHLHLGDGAIFHLVELPAQDEVRVFED